MSNQIANVICQQILKLIIDTVRESYTTLNLIMHCDVISMMFAYYSKQNFSRKKPYNELEMNYNDMFVIRF